MPTSITKIDPQQTNPIRGVEQHDTGIAVNPQKPAKTNPPEAGFQAHQALKNFKYDSAGALAGHAKFFAATSAPILAIARSGPQEGDARATHYRAAEEALHRLGVC